MKGENSMRKYEYSKELANCVKQFLNDDNWHFSFNESTGVFNFNLRIKSKIQKISYVIAVHEDDIIVYGTCPIGAECSDTNMMAQMAEFFCWANYGLKNGCFEFDFRDGAIRYRCFLDSENLIPSKEVIKNSIYCIAGMYDSYAPGITGIIFSDWTAKQAIAKCEKSAEDEIRSMLTEDGDEDMGESDVEEMIARLAARLGLTEDDVTGSDEGSDDSDEIRVDPFDGNEEGGIN
jgi:hypothetical protein